MPNLLGVNGSRPAPPDELIQTHVEALAARRMTNKEIVHRLTSDGIFDTTIYSLTVDVLKKRRAKWKTPSTRSQRIHANSPILEEALEEIITRYPSLGSHLLKVRLQQEKGIHVARTVILEYLRLHYPHELNARRAHKLIRRTFWCTGVNDIWCFDQHDKWRKFELYLHIGMEPYSGKILWLTIWWTNRNPRAVCEWYLRAVEENGRRIALMTQSDRGSENNGIANAQTILRHRQQPDLGETTQHKFLGGKRNIKPEILWRILRQIWVRFFEELLESGLDECYHPENILERTVFHYVFIPYLQRELDIYRAQSNDTKPRFNRLKAIPHGRPCEIYNHPEDYDSEDFSVQVTEEQIAEARTLFAQPDHVCHQLAPPAFIEETERFYAVVGRPVVTAVNVWDVYKQLRDHFRAMEHLPHVQAMLTWATNSYQHGADPMDVVQPVQHSASTSSTHYTGEQNRYAPPANLGFGDGYPASYMPASIPLNPMYFPPPPSAPSIPPLSYMPPPLTFSSLAGPSNLPLSYLPPRIEFSTNYMSRDLLPLSYIP